MMSYDKLEEIPTLEVDRQRIMQGGAALADWMQEFAQKLQEQYLYQLNRYANHFRGWTHASNFDKIDGGDHYAGSIATAAVALNAITNVQSAYSAGSFPVADTEIVIQTMVFTATGSTIVIQWGGLIGEFALPTDVKLRLYRGSDLLIETGNILTVNNYRFPSLLVFVETPAAGVLTYTLRALCTVAAGEAVVSNRILVGLEYKR